MIFATWSTCRHIRRQRASSRPESSQSLDVHSLSSPYTVTASMTNLKDTEFSQIDCVVCRAYHPAAEIRVSGIEAGDVEKGIMTSACG